MLQLLAITIFAAAALLFLLEPLAGKLYLPLLGGSPAVWNTCLMFFQGVLLLAYLYAHRLSRFSLKTQQLTHTAVLLAALASLPVRAIDLTPSTTHPVWWLLGQLSIAFGPAFFAISATGPLLQTWFARTSHKDAKDPYFLYAASNAGSALGLIAYPLVVEPTLTRAQQSWWWAGGYATLVVLAASSAVMMRRGLKPLPDGEVGVGSSDAAGPMAVESTRNAAPSSHPTSHIPHPTLLHSPRLRWIILALVPSSLMMGVTQHITTDIAAVPLLWVAPLTLYLLSYMVAFARRSPMSSKSWGILLVVPLVLVLFLLLSNITGELWQLPIHLLTFFIAATMCHRALTESRPPAARLTEFYLMIAVGGALGGVFNALLAPAIFNSIVEYPLLLGAACLLRPRARPASRVLWLEIVIAVGIVAATLATQRIVSEAGLPENHAKRLLVAAAPTWLCLLTLLRGSDLRFGLTALGLLLITPFTGTTAGAVLRHRSFFGVTTVIEWADGKHHTLAHGTTSHGQQALRTPGDSTHDTLSRTPTTYYHQDGPLGDVVRMMRGDGRLTRIVGVGLGAGTIAAYADANTSVHFIEIDPGVVEIASNPKYFTFLSDARERGATVTTWVGDGRLGVAALDQPADLIILDAFSSDAIPVHLMTAEALKVYLDRLAPGGVVMFHISSRTFELAPVVAALAAHHELSAFVREDSQSDARTEKFASEWTALARSPEDLSLLALDPNWRPLTPEADDPLWTDEYTNVLRAIDW